MIDNDAVGGRDAAAEDVCETTLGEGDGGSVRSEIVGKSSVITAADTALD